MDSSAVAAVSAPANIRVLVRVRPLNERELRFNPTNALSISNKNISGGDEGASPTIDFGVGSANGNSSGGGSSEGTVYIVDQSSSSGGYNSGYDSATNNNTGSNNAAPKKFTYDAVFGPTSKQTEVFDSIKGIIDAVCEGYNGTIVAYGQTGSGKTHTIFGEDGFHDNDSSGLVQRSLKSIFHKIAESHVNNLESKSEDATTTRTTTKASFFEIYNERVYDLLSTNSNLEESLPVREDASRGVYVEGLAGREVGSTLEALDVLRCGMDNRRVAATNMNRVSSRSHAVFVLTVKSEITSSDGISKVRVSKFTLVDLAGSERQKATDTAGDRLKEASMINNSLLCLGQVINSLVDREKGKEKHVPFRDSKLTFLLRDSWGGNSKTCLVATVTPSIESLTETISTLKFAQRAKLIKNTAVLNEDTCGSVVALKAEIARLSSELQQRNASAYAAGSNRHSMPSPGFPPLAPRQQGKSNNAPSNDVTITALRNQNSKLSKKMNHLEETTTQREIQVNSLKRKLQQETLIRKCKERRIAYLTDKNKSADAIESEEIVALREEVLLLREQLEGHSTESIEWMLKYKEEKARVEEMENDAANNTMAPNEQDELEVSLVSLLDERDLLKQQVETMNSQRNTEIDSIMTDVTKIETENANLKSALDNKNMEVLQHEEKIRSSEIQLESLQDEVKKAIDCLELAQNDLATEKGKSEALQSSIDSMKKEVKEELQMHKDAHDVATATLNAKISELEAEFIAAMDDNDSLMKKMKDVSDKLESKQVQLDTLQREKDDAMQLLEERGEKESADLEARSAQEQQLRDEIKQLEDTVVTLLREKTEATDSLEKTNLENTALLEVLDSLKVQNAKLQKQVVAVSALEDEVTFVTDEKENVELYLAFAQADLNRSLRLQQNAISNDIAAFDIELALRDETINSIAHEKANLEHELSNVSAQLKELKKSSQEKEAMLQDELAYTKEECESMKHQMEGVKSELDTTKSHYAKSVACIGDRDKKTADRITELQSEKDAVDKELDETKLLLAESFTAKVELDNSNAKIADLESCH
eukprot:g1977.t1.1.5e174188 g1977  g1977.t1 contig11:452500-456007(-)